MKRVEMTLTEGWRFALGPEMPGDEAFAPVRVPHDWTVGRQVSREAALEGAQGWFLRGEVGWYRRTVHVKSLRPGRRHYLDFGGVWECASVWVNDTPVGVQRYGYSPFRLDVTEALRPGENAILVRVDNTGEPADRW